MVFRGALAGWPRPPGAHGTGRSGGAKAGLGPRGGRADYNKLQTADRQQRNNKIQTAPEASQPRGSSVPAHILYFPKGCRILLRGGVGWCIRASSSLLPR